MVLTLSKIRKTVIGNLRLEIYDVTFDSSYPSGGEPLTAEDLGLNSIEMLQSEPQSGFVFEYDRTNSKLKAFAPYTGGGAAPSTAGVVTDSNSAATDGVPLYVLRNPAGTIFTPVAESSATGLVTDSDSAASEGVQLYVVLDEEEYLPGFALGHLEFVSPTNADGTCTVFTGGPTLTVKDDDSAASNGVAIRAIAASGGIEATIAGSGRSILVPLSDGQFLEIADSTTGSTPVLYFDEDESNTFERIRAVVVDDGNEPYKLFEQTPTTHRPVAGYRGRYGSLVAVGPGAASSIGTLGSGGPEFDIFSDPGIAQAQGATVIHVKPAGAGFEAALPGGKDIFIPLANGEFLKVTYAASPAGPQVYWDEDAANSYQRLLAVVVDNADEPITVATEISNKADAGTVTAGLQEVDSTTNLSTVTPRIIVHGL